jgi:hypothetical protein
MGCLGYRKTTRRAEIIFVRVAIPNLPASFPGRAISSWAPLRGRDFDADLSFRFGSGSGDADSSNGS